MKENNEELNSKDPEMLVKALLQIMGSKQRKMPYKSASLMNENIQPIILSSDEKFENHHINFGKQTMVVPTNIIPYLVESLMGLYTKNGIDYFKGDEKAFEEFNDELMDNLDIKFYDLNSVDAASGCGDPNCENCNSECSSDEEIMEELGEKMEDLQMRKSEIQKLSPEERKKLVEKLFEAREIAKDSLEKLDSGMLSPEQMEELKSESLKQMKEHFAEVESILEGRRKQDETDIDLEHIKRVFGKYGPQAAHEELLRLSPEKRDEILNEMVEMFNNK